MSNPYDDPRETEEHVTTILDKVRVRIDEPGQPNVTIPAAARPFRLAGLDVGLVGLVILIVPVAVVIG